jgi:hypothetical protein
MCLLRPGLRCMGRPRLTCFAAIPVPVRPCWWRLGRAKSAQPIVVQKCPIAPNSWRTSNKCRTCWSNCMCRIHYEDDVGGAAVLIRVLVQGTATASPGRGGQAFMLREPWTSGSSRERCKQPSFQPRILGMAVALKIEQPGLAETAHKPQPMHMSDPDSVSVVQATVPVRPVRDRAPLVRHALDLLRYLGKYDMLCEYR